MKPDLIMIGHILNETIMFPDRIIGPVLGSPVAYSSVVASKLGMKTGVVTKIGSDMPKGLLKPFIDANVDTRGIKVEGRHSTKNLLIYDESGNKTLKYLKKAPEILFKDIPKDYLDAEIMYVCPMDNEVPLEAIQDLRDLRKTLAVDLGGYGGATSGGCLTVTKDSREPLKELMKHFDIAKASSEDCRHLVGAKEGEEEDTANLFVKWGANIGIITLGKRGAFVATKESKFEVSAFSARVVDRTGAGDAFSAGFLVEYLRTRDVWRSALFASATASLVIEGTGGVSLARFPTTPEVYERVSALYSLRSNFSKDMQNRSYNV